VSRDAQPPVLWLSSLWMGRLHVASLFIPPPSWLGHIAEPSLESWASSLQGTCDRFHVACGDDLQPTLEKLRARAADASLRIVVVTAHGEADGAGPSHRSYLLSSVATDRNHAAGCIEVSRLVDGLLDVASGPTIVVIDACEVDVSTARSSDGSGLVLVAAPGTRAFQNEKLEGHLTESFLKSFEQAAKHGATVDAMVRDACEATWKRSSNRQRPQPRLFGTSLGDRRVDELLGLTLTGSSNDRLVAAICRLVLDTWHAKRSAPAELIDDLRPIAEGPSDDPTTSPLALLLAIDGLRRTIEAPRDRLTSGAWNEEAAFRALESHLPGHTSDRLLSRLDAEARHVLGWAWVQRRLGTPEEAVSHLKRASDNPAASAPSVRAAILDTLGTAYRYDGQVVKAATAYEHSLELRPPDERVGLEITRQNLGWNKLCAGDFDGARMHFRQCLNALVDDGVLSTSPDHVRSAGMHWIGLCISLLIARGSKIEFDALFDEFVNLSARVHWPDDLRAWCAFLLDLGRDVPRPATLPPRLTDFWSAVSDVQREGKHALPGLEPHLTRPLEMDYDEIARLAGVAWLARQKTIPELGQLRNQLVDRLQKTRMSGIPRPESPPWAPAAPETLRLNTSAWSSWGPLAHVKVGSERPGLLIEPTVTEKYLHVLAWCSSLLILLDAACTPDESIPLLLEGKVSKGPTIQFGFGTALKVLSGTLRTTESRRRSDWAVSLENAWSGFLSTQEQATLERNQHAHYVNRTFEEARRTLNEHDALIAEVSSAVNRADVLPIEADPKNRADESWVSARLTTSHGTSLECGVWMLMKRSDPTVLLLPTHVPESAIVGTDEKSKVVFRRFGSADDAVRLPISRGRLLTNVQT
jgi:hypothetical protein